MSKVVLAAVLLLAASFIAHSTPVFAQFTDDELSCRESISKNGVKLGTKASKLFSKCHKDRVKGKISAATDCNSKAAADPRGKIDKAAGRLISHAQALCAALTPSDLFYVSCPAPCAATVPALDDFTDVATCIDCVVENAAVALSLSVQGAPVAPLLTAERKCHDSIGKSYTKHLKTVLKERTRCQKADEAAGATDTSQCRGSDPRGKILKATQNGEGKIGKGCSGANLSAVGSCVDLSLGLLQQCVFDSSDTKGDKMFRSFYGLLPGGGGTTTTTTTPMGSTTSTTLGGGGEQDPLCPSVGEATILAATSVVPCSSNGDCVIGTCNTGLGLCQTSTSLDTGWTGIAHGSDVNDLVTQRANLLCTGPYDGGADEPCGQCTVLGLRAETRDCRCAGDNRAVCDEPFQNDADDCGGALCECYLGGPLPLSAGNTPACSVNKFSENISGTANVDLGEGQVTANLSAIAYLGINLILPCPACGGTCTAPAGSVGDGCAVDINCDSSAGALDGVCGNYDTTAKDGVREGTCLGGLNNGESCDIDAYHSSFPAPGPSLSGQSLDCFPDPGKNVSGTGLKIALTQTTGVASLPPASVTCGFPPFVTYNCPCGQCSNDISTPCSTDDECSGGGTCVSDGGGKPQPDQCTTTGNCVDLGGGQGECGVGPTDKLCDGIVRASGEGFIGCLGNLDCTPGTIGVDAGACTLTRQRPCFLDPITAVGTPDPGAPIGAAAFCIAKTANGGINTVAGLPGPARISNQAVTATFCGSDPNVQYVPGVGGCP
jgi:hypothetical protein